MPQFDSKTGSKLFVSFLELFGMHDMFTMHGNHAFRASSCHNHVGGPDTQLQLLDVASRGERVINIILCPCPDQIILARWFGRITKLTSRP